MVIRLPPLTIEMPEIESVDLNSPVFDSMRITNAAEIFKRNGYARCNGYLFPGTFINEPEKLQNFPIYDDDIWVCSFPKSGTTWAQEMVWCILNDNEKTELKMSDRFPFIDFNFLINKESRRRKDPEFYEKLMSAASYENLARRVRPRYIKSHLPFDVLPKELQNDTAKAKIIYVIRNPRDACISFYHQRKAQGDFDGSLEQFAELFIKDLVIYGPYWKNILSFWNQRHRSNVLIIRYEDMKKNFSEVIVRVSEFLGKPLPPARVTELCHQLHFDTMKDDPLVNNILPSKTTDSDIIAENVTENGSAAQSQGSDKKTPGSHQHLRSGKVNQWKEAISDKLKENFEKWETANLQNTDFLLSYDV